MHELGYKSESIPVKPKMNKVAAVLWTGAEEPPWLPAVTENSISKRAGASNIPVCCNARRFAFAWTSRLECADLCFSTRASRTGFISKFLGLLLLLLEEPGTAQLST
jgi:hypothetical protein